MRLKAESKAGGWLRTAGTAGRTLLLWGAAVPRAIGVGVVTLSLLPTLEAQSAATTTIADTVQYANGTAAQGTVLLSWPAFVTATGVTVQKGTTSVTLGANGTLSVQLAPNGGGTPIGTFYTVVYHLSDGSVTQEYWAVPVSATPVKLSAVRTTVLPSTVAQQTVSKQYVDQAIARAVVTGVATPGGGVIPTNTNQLINGAGFVTAAGAAAAAPVQSVAGRTGAVVLGTADVSGLATVATSGRYADLAGVPTVPTNNNQLANGAGYVTATGAAGAAPVQTVAGRTGAVVLAAADVSGLAPSATTDTTNAGNITSGTLPTAQVPPLTGAKLPPGPAGTTVTYNPAGVQAPAVTAPFAANAGPVKVAPFAVSAMTAAGNAMGPYNTTSFRYANITNGARLLTTGAVTQVKTYIAATTGMTALYFELWRVNASGTFNLACRSQNLLSATTANATNTYAVTNTCNGLAGDYPGMYAVGTFNGQVVSFSTSAAYDGNTYPTYYANGAAPTSVEDFIGGTTGVTYGRTTNSPIEVYEAKGPVVACLGDSKMQGIPFSGDYLQAAGNGSSYIFPVVAQANYSTASYGTSLIDLSNQPCAWVGRTLGYTYANVAITGSTSTVQVAQALPTVLALKPAVLVVSGTTNDQINSVSVSTSLSNYQAIYSQAIAAGVQKVVMTGVEPAGAVTEAVWANTTYGGDALNAQLKAFCQAQTACLWVGDAVTVALGQYRSGGAVGSLHNIQPAFAAADNLHFSNAGAQAMGLIEANAIEAPTTVGAAVAVPNAFGTAPRSRVATAMSHDGTLGWRWQDTRDYLQMEMQGLDGTALSPTAGTMGQQTPGCLTFTGGKGYVRCDGALTWSQQQATLTATNVKAAGAVSAAHVMGSSAVPTVATGAAASSCSVAGTDLAFTLTCTTGSSPATGTLATVTFATAYTTAPHFAAPGATNAMSAAATTGLYAATSATAVTVSTANALAASTSYAWHYVLVQ